MVPSVILNDGRSMPQLGFGVWQVGPDEVVPAVYQAIRDGYRSIDTAAMYGNEEGVGEAVKVSGHRRDEIFVATKLWNSDHRRAAHALDDSLERLEMDYVDLYLIHWPAPKQDRYVEAWSELVELQKQGKALSIGVSNFTPAHLDRIVEATGVVPAVNQVELHPLLQQAELRAVHQKLGIVTESWSPLGRGHLFDNPILQAIAAKHDKTVTQVILRWHIELGLVVIPKSVTPHRIKENFEIFDFQLDADDLAQIAELDANQRFGGDPDTANYGVESHVG